MDRVAYYHPNPSLVGPRHAAGAAAGARAQAWALMEEECGNVGLARRLLQEASEKDPCDLYVWQARPGGKVRFG